MAVSEGGEKGVTGEKGPKRRKNLNTGADQCIGPAESCAKIGDLVRIMGEFLKRENTYFVHVAKEFRWNFVGKPIGAEDSWAGDAAKSEDLQYEHAATTKQDLRGLQPISTL